MAAWTGKPVMMRVASSMKFTLRGECWRTLWGFMQPAGAISIFTQQLTAVIQCDKEIQRTGRIQIHESSIVGLGNEGHGSRSSQIALNDLDFVVLANELDVEWPCQRMAHDTWMGQARNQSQLVGGSAN